MTVRNAITRRKDSSAPVLFLVIGILTTLKLTGLAVMPWWVVFAPVLTLIGIFVAFGAWTMFMFAITSWMPEAGQVWVETWVMGPVALVIVYGGALFGLAWMWERFTWVG